MPTIHGEALTRGDLSRQVGRLERVAGVRFATLGDGSESGVRVLEFRTGTGFQFGVPVDRAFDFGRCEFQGRSLAWLSPVGVLDGTAEADAFSARVGGALAGSSEPVGSARNG